MIEIRRGRSLGWVIGGVTIIWLSYPDYEAPGYIQIAEDEFIEVPRDQYASIYENLTSPNPTQQQLAMSQPVIIQAIAKANEADNPTPVTNATNENDEVIDVKDTKPAKDKNVRASLKKNLSVFDAGTTTRR